MKVQELIEKVNNGNYHSVWEVELELVLFQLEAIKEGLNPEERCWCIVSTNIYKCEDGYVGVTGPSSLKSEHIDWKDCYCDVVAKEYEEYSTVSYRPKK